MTQEFRLYNSYSRKKEVFKPLQPPFVGMYVCGPTVYGDPHLGHARPAIIFDVLFRYLEHLNYKVRYVRNITDVGHLEDEAGEGEDKIAKKARLEKLEPMEIVQKYTNSYHSAIKRLNTLPPNIEPRATGHIIEQIEFIEKILKNGYGYIVNGNIYFDLLKYAKNYPYGKLSGKIIEDLLTSSRELTGQSEKQNSVDFALWKKVPKEHIMKWNSPWGEGFPGWHLECSTMSAKYLGETFDIHGGGLDLMFPHHESEIAQSMAAFGKEPVKYWIHNNMITINGQKMSKSLGNFITLEQLFRGTHEILEQAYDPMTIRFFILQAHYRSTIDFSNEALKAAEKGLSRMFQAKQLLDNIDSGSKSTFDVKKWSDKCYSVMNDDLNTAKLIAELFEGTKHINNIKTGNAELSKVDLEVFKDRFNIFLNDILGLKEELKPREDDESVNDLMEILLEMRQNARENKDFETSDLIRDKLQAKGIIIKDTQKGTEWEKGN